MLSKKYLTCIHREHKPFLQLSLVDDFTIDGMANLFFLERLKVPEAYSELSRACKMELFAKIVNGYRFLTISVKISIVDVRLCSEYISWAFFPGTLYIFLGKTFLRKKTGRTKEWIFASICWNFTKQTIAFTKKIHNLLKKENKKND